MIKITKYTKLSDILEFIPLFSEKYPDLSSDELEKYLTSVINTNEYVLLIAKTQNGEVAGMAAYHIGTMLYCGKFIQVSSLYVKHTARNKGIALMLLTSIETEGKNQNCDNIVLDSFVTNIESHDIYQRLGFERKTYHFMKNLKDSEIK
ncbi:MAG: GNAT family N-acetyltransferase [Rickettsiales bacterium]|jgi:ribosomal protein S18 acetylase RimI-like enzyme|nr:GNAT family N-acetyltransferase [Rickettsiales bacterium]